MTRLGRSKPPRPPLALASCLRRGTNRSTPGAVSWGPVTEYVVETEHASPPKTAFVGNFSRLRPQREVRNTRSMSELLLQTWTVPGSSLGTVRGRMKYALRPNSAATAPDVASSSSAPSNSQEKEKAASKRANSPASPAKSPANTQKLPSGWREEVRVPPSGRKYRVYVGPRKGQYAETRAKAWEAHERFKRVATDDTADVEINASGKRKRNSGRSCLACDYGRKRRCTCGKRTRQW